MFFRDFHSDVCEIMCCAVRNPLLVLGFYIKLIDDITLAASTSLLSVLL